MAITATETMLSGRGRQLRHPGRRELRTATAALTIGTGLLHLCWAARLQAQAPAPPAATAPTRSVPPAASAPATGASAARPSPAVEPSGLPAGDSAAVDREAGETVAGGPDVPCLHQHERAQELRLSNRLVETRTVLLECSRAECSPRLRQDCVRWLEEVNRAIPSLVFGATQGHIEVSTVKVYMDGQLIAERLDGAAVDVDPGIHQFRFELNSGHRIERRLTVREGEKHRRVVVTFPAADNPLARVSPAHEQVRRPVPLITYLFAGVAVAAASASTCWGLRALSDKREAEDPETGCAPGCPADRTDPVRDKARAADLAAAIAVISAAGAVTSFLLRPQIRTSPPPAAGQSALPQRSGKQLWLGVKGAL